MMKINKVLKQLIIDNILLPLDIITKVSHPKFPSLVILSESPLALYPVFFTV